MRLTEKEWLGLTYYLEIAYSDFDQSSYPKMYVKQKKEIERLQKKVDQLYFSRENKARKNESKSLKISNDLIRKISSQIKPVWNKPIKESNNEKSKKTT